MVKHPYKYGPYLKCHFMLLFIMFGYSWSSAQKKENIGTSVGQYHASIKRGDDSNISSCWHSIQFNVSSKKLTKQAKIVLDSIVQQLIMHPSYHVEIAFWEAMHCFPKKGEKRITAFDRLNEITKYLIETKGIKEHRVVFGLRADIPENESILYVKLTNENYAAVPPSRVPNFRKNEY